MSINAKEKGRKKKDEGKLNLKGKIITKGRKEI
jgi:hypothetical protein